MWVIFEQLSQVVLLYVGAAVLAWIIGYSFGKGYAKGRNSEPPASHRIVFANKGEIGLTAKKIELKQAPAQPAGAKEEEDANRLS